MLVARCIPGSARMANDGGPSPVIGSLSWMRSRSALLRRDSSVAKRFLPLF